MWRTWGTSQNFLLPFIDELWKTWKIRHLKRWKKLLEISSFYTCVTKTNHMRHSSSYTEWDRIFCHFGPFFARLPPRPNKPENQTFEKMKKKTTSGDVIILNLFNKKHDHMKYTYPDMECDRHNCNFRPFFALLPNYWLQKLKFGKNVKKTLDILSFYKCTINQDHRVYGS